MRQSETDNQFQIDSNEKFYNDRCLESKKQNNRSAEDDALGKS